MEPARAQVWKQAAGHEHQPSRRQFRGGPASCCRGTSRRTCCTESHHAHAHVTTGLGTNKIIQIRISTISRENCGGFMSMVSAIRRLERPALRIPGGKRIDRSICTPTCEEQSGWGGDHARAAAAENGRGRRTGICPSSSRAPARRAATRSCHRPRIGTSAPPTAPHPPPPSPAPPPRGASSIPPPYLSSSVLFFVFPFRAKKKTPSLSRLAYASARDERRVRLPHAAAAAAANLSRGGTGLWCDAQRGERLYLYPGGTRPTHEPDTHTGVSASAVEYTTAQTVFLKIVL